MTDTPRRRWLRHTASLLVGLAVVAFFVHAFQRNWASIREHAFAFQPTYLILSFLAFLATSLLATYAWHDSINTLSPRKLTFVESIATMNSSSLMKYIPGKVWSYALQMYLLAQRGIPKSLVLYVNLINISVSLLLAALLGSALLLVAPTHLPRLPLLALFAALVLLDAVCVRFNASLFGGLIGLANRLLKKNIERFDVPLALLIRLHAVHALATVTFALAVYWVCFGIGYRVAGGQALAVMATFLLSEVTAFMAFLSPGGLGVREGVMYALLGGAASGSLAVLVPLAARGVSMVADLVLGSVAVKLLKDLSAAAVAVSPTQPRPR
jgi:uncharacterized membrane protein YbhN (UPF0104 family)